MGHFSSNVPMAAAMVVEPCALPASISSPVVIPGQASSFFLSEPQIRQLTKKGFTPSLAASLQTTKEEFALRIWVVDNSGSMRTDDGHRIVSSGYSERGTDCKFVDSTRWEELRATVEYHMRFAEIINAPTRFRLLNEFSQFGFSASGFSVGFQEDDAEKAIQGLRRVTPQGYTPLVQHIQEIRSEVVEMASNLNGRRVAIVIATDGIPTDQSGHSSTYERNRFVDALRSLAGLPVWLVIRLCTDEDDVVDFYNNLDSILELSVDVLDDFVAEATEIHAVNPWLNYALPLHRVREMGYHHRLFDLIDERKLTKTEVCEFCTIIFGSSNLDGAPDPGYDWKGFLAHVSRLAQDEGDHWNPIKKRPRPLVSTRKLGGRIGFCR